jgi:hypothetical protein
MKQEPRSSLQGRNHRGVSASSSITTGGCSCSELANELVLARTKGSTPGPAPCLSVPFIISRCCYAYGEGMDG